MLAKTLCRLQQKLPTVPRALGTGFIYLKATIPEQTCGLRARYVRMNFGAKILIRFSERSARQPSLTPSWALRGHLRLRHCGRQCGMFTLPYIGQKDDIPTPKS